MAGGAAVAGILYAVSKNRLPIHVIGLIPATDNRPGKNAYVPGDVITMHNGKMVEVLNTDAEGRMILADALSYGDRYNPLVTIDLATLTGSAAAAIGSAAAVCMGNADDSYFNELLEAGFVANEKLVRFPFWDEFGKMIESKVADIKNIGGKEAGAITAGKFLEHFVKAPFIHIDIAAPAFLDSASGYLPSGGTGYGVRLLYQYFSKLK
jgi:leucyl aminopeptidase